MHDGLDFCFASGDAGELPSIEITTIGKSPIVVIFSKNKYCLYIIKIEKYKKGGLFMKVKIFQNDNIQKKNKTFKEFSNDLLIGIESIPNNQLLFLIKAKLYEYFKYKVNALQLDNPEQEKHTLMIINNVLLDLKPSLIENGLKTKSEIFYELKY